MTPRPSYSYPVGSRSRTVNPDPVRRLVSERAQWGRRSSSELLPQPACCGGIRDGEAYRGFPHSIVFCTLRVILAGGDAAVKDRTAASPPACLLHASRDPEGAGPPACPGRAPREGAPGTGFSLSPGFLRAETGCRPGAVDVRRAGRQASGFADLDELRQPTLHAGFRDRWACPRGELAQ